MEAESLFSKCMLLVLEQHSAGGDRKIRKDKLDVRKTDGEDEPEGKSWHASKKIFGASATYKKIGQLDSAVRSSLEKLELPAQFQRGTFAVPIALVQQAQAIVDQYTAEREALVDQFVAEYPQIVADQRKVLGPLFDAADYPCAATVRQRFAVASKWLALGVPSQLKQLSGELYEKEVQAQSKALQETMQEVQSGLRAALKGLIDHLLNRLSQKDESGKVKRLHESAVTNITEFLDMLPAKNVTNDMDLQLLADKARSIVTATDVDQLKSDNFGRAIVEKRLGQIASQLDALISDAPIRKMGGFAEDAA